MIEKLLMNGANEIDMDTIRREGDPEQIKAYFESIGYKVIQESDFMIFEKTGKQLLKG